MPDAFGFDHLGPHHRCIEDGCGWPGYGVCVSEKDRERHHRAHVKEQQAAAERLRLANLAKARRLKKQVERENEAAYG
jgi:hypothetical protein